MIGQSDSAGCSTRTSDVLDARGGDDYFLEQEGQISRSLRAAWIAERLESYRPTSILEIGCGYGKLVAQSKSRLESRSWVSTLARTELSKARQFLACTSDVRLVLSRGESLPFADNSFDMVVTSAVVLHNPPPVAEKLRARGFAGGQRFAAHNEETNLSYNRYGYDTAAWYRCRGIALAESGPIPMDPDPESSQFCVADLGMTA